MINKINYRFNVLIRLKPFAIGVQKFFAFNLALGILVVALNLAQPIFYSMFIEKVILGRKIHYLYLVIVGYIIIQLLNIGTLYLQNICRYRVVNHVSVQIKLKILQNLFKTKFSNYEKLSVGEIKMIMDDDIIKLSVFANTQTIDYIIQYAKMLILCIALFVIDWRLALFSIVSIPITFILDHIISKHEEVENRKNRENNQAWSSWLHRSVNGWREIRLLNLEKHEEVKFTDYSHKYAIHFARWNNYWVTRVLVLPKIKDEFFMQFALYFIGGLLIFNGNIKIGALLVFAQYYSQLSDSVKLVSSTDADLQAEKIYYDKVIDALYKEEGGEQAKGITALNNAVIEFRHVYFRYPSGERDILKDFSLYIAQGERVALIGQSGKGKSTILKLLVGMLKATKGQILFSGVDINQINMKSLHKRIGFVMQENMLFNTSIKENLLYGKENATIEELDEACTKAYIKNYINQLPEKYETIIGEKGVKLSGGQRQRLILARLFLKDVDVFIFDEATSALDQHSEEAVHDAINNISKAKTIIVVAHRISSISLCNRKIYL